MDGSADPSASTGPTVRSSATSRVSEHNGIGFEPIASGKHLHERTRYRNRGRPGYGDPECVCRCLFHLSIDQIVARSVGSGSNVRVNRWVGKTPRSRQFESSRQRDKPAR